MADDKRVAALQDEIKLLKGELKNSLSSVREYLLNMELPSSEFSTILAALSGDGSSQKVTIDGNIGNKPAEPEAPASEIKEETEQEVSDALEQPPEDENLIDVESPEEELSEEMVDENPETEEETLNQEDNPLLEEENLNPEDELPPEEELEEGEEPGVPDADNEEMAPESELPAEEERPMALDQSTSDVNQAFRK